MNFLVKLFGNSKFLLGAIFLFSFLVFLNKDREVINNDYTSYFGVFVLIWLVVYVYRQMWKKMNELDKK